MPRRRTSEAPVKRRTRQGCLTCRARKIKCNDARPVCGQCLAKGLPCQRAFPLKWEVDYAAKGLAFGRESKYLRQSSTPESLSPTGTTWCLLPVIHPHYFINTTVSTSDELVVLENESNEEVFDDYSIATRDIGTRMSPPRLSDQLMKLTIEPPPSCHGLRSDQAGLLAYFVDKVCPLSIASHKGSSPLASLVLPFSISTSTSALDATLALAACHRSRADTAWGSTALRLSNSAIKGLQRRLEVTASSSLVDPEALVVMMLLCLYEISSQCEDRWVIHLKGARDLVRMRRKSSLQLGSPDQSDLTKFAETCLAYFDVIGRTACAADPVFGEDFWIDSSRSCDPWLGCSMQLVSILASVTDLSHKHRESPLLSSSVPFQERVMSLETKLSTLQQEVKNPDDDILSASAELKRLTAELYLQCALNGAAPQDEYVKRRVHQILQMVWTLLKQRTYSGLTWPLFVAAVELDPEDILSWESDIGGEQYHDKAFILSALNVMLESMANVKRTRLVIEQVWYAREMADSPVSGQLQVQNDWEKFVAPYCANMSLL